MIPTIIYLLMKRYKRNHPEKAESIQSFINKCNKCLLLVLICLASAIGTFSQEKKLTYSIKRNGSEVGNVQFTQNTSGNRTTLKMESEVRTRFVFLFTAKAKEETIYDSGIMTWSSIYRKMNGNVKADKKIKATDGIYTIYNDDKTEKLTNFPIRYNMLSLYLNEPTSFSTVFSDNFQQVLTIQTVNPHHYKIKFPDGNSNEYFYTNGMCTKVKISHSLYSATIELKS
jgi:hypothetical protein